MMEPNDLLNFTFCALNNRYMYICSRNPIWRTRTVFRLSIPITRDLAYSILIFPNCRFVPIQFSYCGTHARVNRLRAEAIRVILVYIMYERLSRIRIENVYGVPMYIYTIIDDRDDVSDLPGERIYTPSVTCRTFSAEHKTTPKQCDSIYTVIREPP